MIAKYNRKSLAIGIPGLLIQIGCIAAMNFLAAQAKAAGEVPSAALASGLAIGSLLGALLLITGLCFYAKAKGYTPVLGLLGLLSCLGLLILAVLPDKTKGLNEDAG